MTGKFWQCLLPRKTMHEFTLHSLPNHKLTSDREVLICKSKLDLRIYCSIISHLVHENTLDELLKW